MCVRNHAFPLALAAISLCGAVASAQAPIAPPPPPPPTVWSFLGIPQAYKHVHDGVANRFGKHPACERKPPLKALADPANLKSENPAIKKAAEIKKEEDLKQQKIKAVRYLAQIGCGCYNRDGSITDALLKSLDDCTEDVRLATVMAITEAAYGEMCENCKMKSCCSEEISNKLYEIAYERDEEGCYLEPSERVRLTAAEALRACCPGVDEEPTYAEPMGGGQREFEQPGSPPSTEGGRPPAPNPSPEPPTPEPTPAREAGRLREQTADATSEIPEIRYPDTGHKLDHAVAIASQSSRRSAAVRGVAAPAPERAGPAAASSSKITALIPPPPAAVPQNPTRDNSASGSDAPAPIVHALEWNERRGTATTAVPPPADQKPAPVVSASSAREQSSRRRRTTPIAPASGTVIPASTLESPSNAEGGRDTESARPEGKVAEEQATLHSVLPASPLSIKMEAVKIAPVRRQRELPGAQFGTVAIRSVHTAENLVRVQLDGDQVLPIGSVLRAYHSYALVSRRAVCDLEVIESEPGLAITRPRNGDRLGKLAVGDEAIVLK